MLIQIAVGAGLVALTSLVQAAFMLSGFRALQALRTHERSFSHHHATFIIVLFVLFMFCAMILETAIWAAVYQWLGAVQTAEGALYVSIGSFTTIGFADVHISERWRLLVAIEGVNGMMIFGWATALVIAAIQHFDVWPSTNDAKSQPNSLN
jgi:hypothetical protein